MTDDRTSFGSVRCLPTIGQVFLGDTWDVECSCGFVVTKLGTREAADDTVAWHLGKPSALGGDL